MINGEKKKLYPGDLVMIRPDDEHTFTSADSGIILMNLAFSMEEVKFLRSRYFPGSESFFWTTNHLPYLAKLELRIIQRITQRAESSNSFRTTQLYLDSLLLFIFRMVLPEDRMGKKLEMPEWLVNAFHNFNSPIHFEAGVNGFAKLCEKHVDYVSRMVKKYFNKTLSELIRDKRLTFASRQLIITNTPIKLIAKECGYENLGHFYKVFKQVYGQTPSNYRRTNQTVS